MNLSIFRAQLFLSIMAILCSTKAPRLFWSRMIPRPRPLSRERTRSRSLPAQDTLGEQLLTIFDIPDDTKYFMKIFKQDAKNKMFNYIQNPDTFPNCCIFILILFGDLQWRYPNIIGLTLHEYRKTLAHLQHLTYLQCYTRVYLLNVYCQPLPYYEETLCMSGIDINLWLWHVTHLFNKTCSRFGQALNSIDYIILSC